MCMSSFYRKTRENPAQQFCIFIHLHLGSQTTLFKKKKTLTYFLLLEMTSEEKAEYENAKANGLLEVVADEEEKVIEKKKVKEEKKEKVQKK